MPRPIDSATAHGGRKHVVRINAHDETDDTGAPLMYSLQWVNGLKPQAVIFPFQTGDPNRNLNGLTEQALLAVLIDRCAERSDRPMGGVLYHLRHALATLNEPPTSPEQAIAGLRLVPNPEGPAG